MTIVYNAKVYTLDPSQPVAEALAIEQGRVLAVGDSETILKQFSSGTQSADRFDAGGRAVIPGLTDAHIHLELYALSLQKVDCETGTRQECLQRVAQRAQTTPEGSWILGHGWNQNSWPEGFGTASDLDQAAPGRPVYLTAKSLHAAWANTAALRLAGVHAQTADPPGGRIQRDERGEPTGILFESAMQLVSAAIPEPAPQEVAQAILEAQTRLWQSGLTGLHDFDQRRCFAALQILHSQDRLGLRVVKSIPLDDLPHAAALGLRTGFGDDLLRIGSVKAFADGALGPRTAAMFQPYAGEPDNRGLLLLDAEDLFEQGRLAVESGLSLAVHAIGDLANHEVLEAFAQLREFERQQRERQGGSGSTMAGRTQAGPSRAGAPGAGPYQAGHLRHRIEHVQLIHPEDGPRLAQLGVIASMQPIHATSDMAMADRYWGERAAHSYAWRTQQEHGAVLAFGSDAPVEPPDPFRGIHAAVTRRSPDGAPGPEGWYPSQRLAVEEALRAYTSGPAYAAGLEDRLGRLAPGCLADLLVLQADPFRSDPQELHRIRPLATMVGGEWLWKA